MPSVMKLIWIAIPALIVAALVTLSFVGIPAPKVPVSKNIPIDNLLKSNEQSS